MSDRPPNRRSWLDLLADAPLLGLTAAIVVLLVRTFSARVGHPFDLEWMEGGMLLHALRVTEGQALYVAPSSDYIPFIYPPLYHWLVAAVGSVFELGYPVGRAISFVGTLLGGGALVAAVRGEGDRASLALGLGAAGLFLSGYDESGSFYDLVRIDGLLIALTGWSLLAIRHGWLRAGGVLLTLAFLTKHNAAAFGLPALIWLWRADGRAAALRFAAWSVGPALAATLALQLEGDGLFLTYLLAVPATHGFVPERAFLGTPEELFKTMAGTTTLALLVLPVLFAGKAGLKATRGHRYWAAQGLLALLLCVVMRGHQGGYKNVLIPGFWFAALWGALAIDALRARFDGPPAARFGVRLATAALVAGTLWQGRWSPERFSPTVADREAGERLVSRIAAVDGPVLAPWSPWLPVAAGKAPGLHLIGLWDIDHKGGALEAYTADIEADFAAQKWTVVLTASENLGHGFKQAYRKAERVRPAGKAMRPRTGWQVRPGYFWRPIDRAAAAESEDPPSRRPRPKLEGPGTGRDAAPAPGQGDGPAIATQGPESRRDGASGDPAPGPDPAAPPATNPPAPSQPDP